MGRCGMKIRVSLAKSEFLATRRVPFPYTPLPSTLLLLSMAQPTTTPKHTDPETKQDEKKNEETVKDKPDGKKKTTQKG